jgi:hypothetical protein
MAKIKSGDRCADCTHCKSWSTDRNKASCDLHHEQGFHPDRSVPQKCVGGVTRRF